MDPNADRHPGQALDRAWADPLLALLALVALVLSGLALRVRSTPAPLLRAGLQGRLAELPFAAERLPSGPARLPLRPAEPQRLADSLREPWDRALVGVLAAGGGDLALGRRLARDPDLPGPAGAAFRTCWDRAFESGPPVTPEQLDAARRALGDGWAAGLLEARLVERDGGDGAAVLQRALQRCTHRLIATGAAGAAGAAAVLAGFGLVLARLFQRRSAPPAVPAQPVSGRAVALASLGWYLGLQLAGSLTAPLLAWLPALQPYSLPMTYGLHALWGLLLLRLALGTAWPVFWRGLWPKGRRSAAWGLGYLALAVPLVLAASWAAGPLTRRLPAPQRELVEFLSGLPDGLPLLMALATVAVVAPFFEELLFRGALLPVMARRWGWWPGIAATGLLFGAIHLQPAGMPALGVLGLVLGAAFRKAGLLAPILVHALWNGTVFLFLRAMVT